MPIAQARPTSDLLDFTHPTSAPPVTGTPSSELGLVADIKGSSVDGYLGRFELEIPSGSTINGVRLTLTSSGNGVSNFFNRGFGIGFIDDDGVWPANGFEAGIGFYPRRLDVPWPWRYDDDAVSFIDNQGAWVGNADPASVVVNLNPIPVDDPYRFGEGIAPVEVSAPGIVANLQAWLDGTGDTLRGNTASGTALPVAFCVCPNQTGLSWQFVFARETATEARRPLLEVDYTEGNTAPSIAIDTPATGSSHVGGSTIHFTATATDPEDGDLSASVQWSSDVDGALGSGSPLLVSTLSPASHVITASVTDAGALTSEDSILLTVGPGTPAPNPDPPTGVGDDTEGIDYEHDSVASVEFTPDAGPSVAYDHDSAPSVDFEGDSAQTVAYDHDSTHFGDGSNE